MTHSLIFRKGGLVIAHKNEVRGKLLYTSRQDFTQSSVCAKPLIHKGRTISERDIRQGNDKDKETRGDVMIRGLWYQKSDTIIDVKLGDADADYYKYGPMVALLAW